MAAIIEQTSTITAKGQTTVPKAVRQALGVDYGGKMAYRIEEGRVTVHDPEAEHHDPTLAAFLGLIEKDIAAGRNVRDRSGTGSFQSAILRGGISSTNRTSTMSSLSDVLPRKARLSGG